MKCKDMMEVGNVMYVREGSSNNAEEFPGQLLLSVLFQRWPCRKVTFRKKVCCTGDDDPAHLLKEFFSQSSLRLGHCSFYTPWERSLLQCERQSLPLPGAEHAASAGLG